ncbi:hypothetical protein MJA45_18830 [Paenibacillus aurantius]|uniref:Lipoprotein n=1 Tax=Paenibacillus aurantius TaxID=2918900 RepID=A0AA96RBQ7_9BACL|nr:hypothetical protein [Paenibacillus aurantius]WNQ09670.1 hypothetical protein MJA45_18830 [Paenibacillus aurantius]
MNKRFCTTLGIMILLLVGCGNKLDERRLADITSELEKSTLSKYVGGNLKSSVVDKLKLDDYKFYRYQYSAEANSDFEALPKTEKYKILKDSLDTARSVRFDCGEKNICTIEGIELKNGTSNYLMATDPLDKYEFKINNATYEPETTTVQPSKTQSSPSTYTKEQLQKDPKAPSKDPADYNKNGEYVPKNGISNNPNDYNAKGEYKPVESMTKEEIKKELEDMLKKSIK